MYAFFRVAVLRKWRSKYGPTATHRNLAKCFYDADKLEVVEATCRALGTPDGSAEGQQQGSNYVYWNLLLSACTNWR